MSPSPYFVIPRGKISTPAGPLRCEALTARRTRCRHVATGFLGNSHSSSFSTHLVCDVHWQHTPRRGWW